MKAQFRGPIRGACSAEDGRQGTHRTIARTQSRAAGRVFIPISRKRKHSGSRQPPRLSRPICKMTFELAASQVSRAVGAGPRSRPQDWLWRSRRVVRSLSPTLAGRDLTIVSLAGGKQQRRRDFEPDALGSPKVDHELERGRGARRAQPSSCSGPPLPPNRAPVCGVDQLVTTGPPPAIRERRRLTS